ncbi:MAG: alginate export family protein [Nitrospirota bacterium]
MRKYLAILLGILLIFSFAATAFAIHVEELPPEAVVTKGPASIMLGGKILVRGWYFKNVGSVTTEDEEGETLVLNNLPVRTDSQAFYTTNANLTVSVKVGDNVRGYMDLETASGGSGNPNSGLYVWGTYDTKPAADLFFRELWLQYSGSGLMGVPVGVKAGHMPITLGEKQFLNNERFGDDAILLWIDPAKELHILLGTAKMNEGVKENHTDDLDGYVALFTYMWDKANTVGANWTWAHSDGRVPSLPGSPNVDELNFHNIGIHGNGKIAGVTYSAEADFQFGKAKDVLFEGNDMKFRGWGVFAKLGYMIDPINLRASFAYGSGDNDNDDKNEEFQTLQGPDELAPVARIVHYTQIYERTVRTTAQQAVLTTTLGGNVRNTNIANTTYYNVGLDVNPTKELSLSLDGFIIRASKNQFGSKSAGTELDIKGNYKIATNLSYFVEAGAFWPGDYYEDTFDIKDKTVSQVVHGLLLTF